MNTIQYNQAMCTRKDGGGGAHQLELLRVEDDAIEEDVEEEGPLDDLLDL